MGIGQINFIKSLSKKKIILSIVALLVICELLALVWLFSTVSTYKNFWVRKAKEPGEITYLALGDSAAQGIGATSPSRGYVGLVGARLQKLTNKSVRIINLSVSGAKMDDYLKDQATHINTIKADLVTIEIGANDVATFDSDKYRSDFKKVLSTLPEGAYIANMPLFNSRPSSSKKAKQASLIIQEELRAFPNLNFVNLEKQTADNQSIFGFAPDLFHPNNLSYKNWADAFWVKIQSSDQFVLKKT